MRKAGRNRGNIRKRLAADEDPQSTAVEAKGDDTSIMRPPKVPKAGAMAFTTRHTGDDPLRPFNFASSRTLQQTTDQGATATLETETAFDRDARWVGICDALRPRRPLAASVGCWSEALAMCLPDCC